MTRLFTKSLSAFALLFAVTFTTQASADVYDHIDRLAVKIRNKARLLVNETRHYRNTPEYNHLLNDALRMRDLAEHIHEVAHHEGNLAHLESDLRELDAQFHHIEGLIDNIERQAFYGCRIVEGRTAHVKRLLNSIEDYIHHLQEDIASLRRPVPCPFSRPATYVEPQIPVLSAPRVYHNSGYPNWNHYGAGGHGYGNNGFSFSIGGGSSRIQFRF